MKIYRIIMAEETTEGIKLSKFIPIILGVTLLIAGIVATALLIKQKPEILGLSKGQAVSQAEVDRLVDEVGMHISLPTDEKPTVATITDVEKLREQTFFKKAKNGDKVLIYTNAKKAILYSPTEKRVIEVGAVNINQQATGEPEATPAPTTEGASEL